MWCIHFNDLNAVSQSKKNGLHIAPRRAADGRAQRSCGYAVFRWREQGTPARALPVAAALPAQTPARRCSAECLLAHGQPFPGWSNLFPNPGMTVAAIDRLLYHSTIFELHKDESYREKPAPRQQQKQCANDKVQRQRQSPADRDSQPEEPQPRPTGQDECRWTGLPS
jgi:hypothetical protein